MITIDREGAERERHGIYAEQTIDVTSPAEWDAVCADTTAVIETSADGLECVSSRDDGGHGVIAKHGWLSRGTESELTLFVAAPTVA